MQAAADLLRQEFRVCKAVAVADEDGLLFRLNGASLHAVDQREDGIFAAAGLRDVDEVAFVVHMEHGLDAERAADEGRRRRDAAAALQEEQIVDREPVAQVQAVVFSVLCSLLQRCAVLQLLHGQPDQQALTHGGAQRVDRQNLPLGIALAQLLRGDLGGAVGAAQTG